MAKEYKYKGFTIKKGEFGWFGEPIVIKANEDRYGYTKNYPEKIMVEVEIDSREERRI